LRIYILSPPPSLAASAVGVVGGRRGAQVTLPSLVDESSLPSSYGKKKEFKIPRFRYIKPIYDPCCILFCIFVFPSILFFVFVPIFSLVLVDFCPLFKRKLFWVNEKVTFKKR